MITATDPRHGSYAGAIAHWKHDLPLCDPCRIAARRKRKKNQLDALNGTPAMVTLGDAHRVITTMPRNQLVAATGIAHRRMKDLADGGPGKRVHRRTRDRILAAEKRTWTPIGIQRRLQALTALGWSMQALHELGVASASNLARLRRNPNPKHVRLEVADRILAAYERLSMQPAPSGISASETRNEAVRRRYAPPLAWDDGAIDDPQARPSAHWRERRPKTDVDPVVVERFLVGDYRIPTTNAERFEITRRWLDLGRSLRQLEKHTGWQTYRYTPDKREDSAA